MILNNKSFTYYFKYRTFIRGFSWISNNMKKFILSYVRTINYYNEIEFEK